MKPMEEVQPVQPLLFCPSAPAPPPPLPKRASKVCGPAASLIGPEETGVAQAVLLM